MKREVRRFRARVEFCDQLRKVVRSEVFECVSAPDLSAANPSNDISGLHLDLRKRRAGFVEDASGVAKPGGIEHDQAEKRGGVHLGVLGFELLMESNRSGWKKEGANVR